MLVNNLNWPDSNLESQKILLIAALLKSSMPLFLTKHLVILWIFLPFWVKWQSIKVFYEGFGDLNTVWGALTYLGWFCAGIPRVTATEWLRVNALKLPTCQNFYYSNTMKQHAAKKKWGRLHCTWLPWIKFYSSQCFLRIL